MLEQRRIDKPIGTHTFDGDGETERFTHAVLVGKIQDLVVGTHIEVLADLGHEVDVLSRSDDIGSLTKFQPPWTVLDRIRVAHTAVIGNLKRQ